MRSRSGFTLIELSVVVLVLALLAAAAMRYANSQNDSNSITATNATLDALETALYNFENNFGRLPCPADLTQSENAAAFGTEVGTAGDGSCTGYNYINSATDPDAAGGSDNNYGGAADPLYDATTASQVVIGAIPTKALHIPDKLAYDAWGNKIFYAVDKRMTAASAFITYAVTNATIGAIVIKKASKDTLANAVTYKAIYALVSTGKNGHGGYARNLASAAIRVNAGSTNTDELDNCHCSSSAVATAFNRIFVQKSRTANSASFTDSFDDITRFRTRASVNYSTDLQ
jgi:prepilin-type N-terminal cleavage/methylation domain-containing protein